MSWESEFASQWQKFLTIVESRIRQEIDSNKKLDSEFINYIIRSEVDTWSISIHYNGAWLRNLKRKLPSLGEEFQAALEELRLNDNISFNLDLPIARFSKIVASAWAIFLILFLVWSGYNFLVSPDSQIPEPVSPDSQVSEPVSPDSQVPEPVSPDSQVPEPTQVSAWEMVGLPFMKLLLGTAIVALVGIPIVSNLRANQKKNALDNLVEQIQKELEPTGQKLKNIAVRADEANF